MGIICGPEIICGPIWGSFAVPGSFAEPYSTRTDMVYNGTSGSRAPQAQSTANTDQNIEQRQRVLGVSQRACQKWSANYQNKRIMPAVLHF